jgi:nucleoside-diphosphate-sugar epimerase
MKLVIIGGTRLIGSKVVTTLREHGHEAVAASPHTGVNTLNGEGLADVLQGASVVVDVSNSPSFAVTRNPQIVYSSNVMAMLGLRSMYFVLSDTLERVPCSNP